MKFFLRFQVSHAEGTELCCDVEWNFDIVYTIHIPLKQLRFAQEAAIERENMWINDVRHEKIDIFLLSSSLPPKVDTIVASTVELWHIFVIKSFDDST